MRLLAPLRIKAIALLWGGLSTSSVGDQLGTIALTWIAVDALGAAAGYLTACQAGITLLSALVIGRWTDGRNERWIMVAADVCRATVLLAVVVVWEVSGRVSAGALAVLIIALAVGQAAFRPAVQAIMPVLSPSAALLPAINGLLDGTDRLARLLGPGLIALVAARLPVVHFLTLDAASFLISAAAVMRLGARPTRSVRATAGMSFLRGFQAMRRHRLLGYLLRTASINNGAWYAAMFLGVPLLLARGGDAAVGSFAAVIVCYGVTNFGGNLVVGGRPPVNRPDRLILWGNVVNGSGLMLMGLGALLPGMGHTALFAGALVAGAGGPMNDIPRTTLMQTALSAEDVAPAFRTWMVAAAGGILVAMLGAPTLFSTVGAAAGIAVFGGLIVAAAVPGFLLGLETVGVADVKARG